MYRDTWHASRRLENAWLIYAFWRAWILVMYSAPIWSNFTDNAAFSSNVSMYIWSTLSFAVVCVLLAVYHRRAESLLNHISALIASALVAGLGVVFEFAALWFLGSSASPLFVVGSLLNGSGTAYLAVFAGNAYACYRPADAMSRALLSEGLAGLVFFFAIGSFPQVALALGVLLLPAGVYVAALGMRFSDDSVGACFAFEASGEKTRSGAPDADTGSGEGPAVAPVSSPRRSSSSFYRFLTVVFILTFAASFTHYAERFQQDPSTVGVPVLVGVTAVIFVAFVVGFLVSCSKRFNFSLLYYPLVLLLAFSIIMVFAPSQDFDYADAAVVFVYDLFSTLMWCLLTYVAKGERWTPTQVFGWGRCVYAAGSLAGLFVVLLTRDIGMRTGLGSESFMFGLLLAFAVLAVAVVVFREADAYRIIHATDSVEAPEGVGALPDEADAVPSRPTEGTMTPEEWGSAHGLTKRESEVFLLMLEGRNARAVAERLYISENTAKAHIRNIYGKAGVHTRQEFVDAVRAVRR